MKPRTIAGPLLLGIAFLLLSSASLATIPDAKIIAGKSALAADLALLGPAISYDHAFTDRFSMGGYLSILRPLFIPSSGPSSFIVGGFRHNFSVVSDPKSGRYFSLIAEIIASPPYSPSTATVIFPAAGFAFRQDFGDGYWVKFDLVFPSLYSTGIMFGQQMENWGWQFGLSWIPVGISFFW